RPAWAGRPSGSTRRPRRSARPWWGRLLPPAWATAARRLRATPCCARWSRPWRILYDPRVLYHLSARPGPRPVAVDGLARAQGGRRMGHPGAGAFRSPCAAAGLAQSGLGARGQPGRDARGLALGAGPAGPRLAGIADAYDGHGPAGRGTPVCRRDRPRAAAPDVV